MAVNEGTAGRPAVVALGREGARTARRIARLLPGAEVHGLARRIPDADVAFEDAGAHLRALFAAGRPVVGVCAAGILIRAIAPALSDKRGEPPVVAVAGDGSAVAPLLGGHRGANDLARRIAGLFGVAPAVTTAGDARFGAAFDDPPPGWTLANRGDAKEFAAALLNGAAVRFPAGAPSFLECAAVPRDDRGSLRITATERAVSGGPRHLVYHPACLAVGVGCERGAAPGELTALVGRALAEAGLAEAAVAGVFSLDLKSDEPAVHASAAALGVEARFFDAAALEAEAPRLASPSEAVFRAVGCHGVAEGAALAASGASGELIVPKRKSGRTTCAVAMSPEPIDPFRAGRPRGRLLIAGIGPGGDGWMTAECREAVAAATDLVGYGRYLDLLGDRTRGKALHEFRLGEEAARARLALDLAARGRTVALVSSGDPGIYAMASLVFELIDTEERAEWRQPEIAVCPGVSALQAAAARAGAPLGNDFCAVSLSDLLTPWAAIERRVRAAAAGDFVVAFYNPVSRRRDWQLAEACRILLEVRPPATPAVVARNLGRPEETVRISTLGELRASEVDMLTVIIVGSSETRAAGDRWVYTPRGYAAAGG